MKFTKTTAVAVAIAGIAAAPMIASADTTLSGIVEVNVNGYAGDVAGVDIGDAGDPAVGTGDVLFGILAEHELNSGLTGYGSLRADLDRLSNAGSTAVDASGDSVKTLGSADSVYVGIKGGFGDFRLGEIPLAVEYGQLANDIFDVGAEVNGGLSYTGTFGPVGLIANFSPENNSADGQVGLGAKFALGGFSIGLGAEQRGADDNMNAAAGASFTIAGASVAAHYATQEAADSGSDVEIIAAQVGYGFGGVSAKVTYTVSSSDLAGSDDQTAIRLDLLYAMGGGLDLSTRLTNKDKVAGDDGLLEGTEWRIQLSKSF